MSTSPSEERKVIHIYGASGSGTSTLGRALCVRSGFRQLDVDDCFWLPDDPPFSRRRSPEERLRRLCEGVESAARIVVTGSLCGWGDVLIPYFDLAVRLAVPVEIRMERLKEREFRRFGARILPGGDMHTAHLEFLRWAAEYDTGAETMRSKAMHDRWAAGLACRRLELDGSRPIGELFREIDGYFSCRFSGPPPL